MINDNINKNKRRAFSIKEKEGILSKTDFKCAHCGKVLNLDTITVEHIFPVARGGTDNEFNLVALCVECNEAKSNMIYNIRDYYKHIKEEYLNQYETELESVMKTAINPRKRIMAEDVRLYRGVNPMYMQMAYQAFRRNKSKAMKMIKESSIIAKYELSFEAEAEDIFNFIKKMKDKGEYTGTLYDNEYKIKELIKYGQVYTFRLPDKSIKGVVGLFNMVRNKEEIPMQIESIANANEQEVLHLITMFLFDSNFLDANKLVERDLFNEFILSNLKIVTFSETDKIHSIMRYSDKIINMPFKFRGTDGFIQCYTGPGDREATEKIKNLYKDREETEGNE